MGERNCYNEKTLTLGKDDLKDKSVKIFVQDNQKHVKHFNYLPLIQKEKVQKPLLSTFDTILSLVLLGPSVVGFWRGTWDLMDVYNTYFPKWLCVLIGLSIHFAFVLIQDALNKSMQKKSPTLKKKIFNMVLIRIYIYIFAISSVMHWRGGWEYIEAYFELKENPRGIILKEGSRPLIIATAGALFCIMALRSLRNCVAPPFVFCIDRKNNAFVIPTRFKTKINESASLYILDCLFSVLVIGTLVVFVWRGAWAIIDIYLFPENEVWSSWGSLIVGYSAVAIAFMLQPFMRWLCDRITGVSRLLAADLFLILSLIGTVNVWRGIWNLLNIYLLPDNMELSCWISHWVCFIILVLLGCSNSLLVRGVYIDAEEPAGKCVIFPCYYLRLIFQEQKLKKIQTDQNKTEMLTVKPSENNHIVSVPNTTEQPLQNLSINHKEGDV